MNEPVHPRQNWLDYLHSIDALIDPVSAVAVANTEVVGERANDDLFLRRFTAYFVLTAIDYETDLKQMLSDAGISPGMRVLDVGCGSGAISQFMLDLEVSEVTGIDLPDDVLIIANNLSLTSDYANRLHFIKHNMAEPLPLEDNSFDAVLVANGEIPMYRESTLLEYRRVLKDGGRIIFIMMHPHKRYAWNMLIEHLMSYAFYLNLLHYWGEDGFLNQEREGYDSLYQRARASLNMMLANHVPYRIHPFPRVTELAVQQRFALITGPIFKKRIAYPEKWALLQQLHDPGSDMYLFKRADAYISDVIEVGTAQIRK